MFWAVVGANRLLDTSCNDLVQDASQARAGKAGLALVPGTFAYTRLPSAPGSLSGQQPHRRQNAQIGVSWILGLFDVKGRIRPGGVTTTINRRPAVTYRAPAEFARLASYGETRALPALKAPMAFRTFPEIRLRLVRL